MAVIAVGSRPETPDVTKFFELPAIDSRFKGRAHAEAEREREREREGSGQEALRILGIHISVGG